MTYRLVEDSRKYKQEDDIHKIDSGNRDVERVGLLVHPRPEDTDTNEENRFNDDQSDSLHSSVLLCKGKKERLNKDVK